MDAHWNKLVMHSWHDLLITISGQIVSQSRTVIYVSSCVEIKGQRSWSNPSTHSPEAHSIEEDINYGLIMFFSTTKDPLLVCAQKNTSRRVLLQYLLQVHSTLSAPSPFSTCKPSGHTMNTFSRVFHLSSPSMAKWMATCDKRPLF